jgi:hypothetical protein
MAYLVNAILTAQEDTTVSSVEVDIGETKAGDLIVLFVNETNSHVITYPAGYTEFVAQQGTSAVCRFGACYKIAGANEPNPTVSVASPVAFTVGAEIYRDVDGTAPFDVTDVTLCTGSINSGSTTLTFSGATGDFVAGVTIMVPGAGVSGANLLAYVSSVGAGTATLATAASTTVSNVTVKKAPAQIVHSGNSVTTSCVLATITPANNGGLIVDTIMQQAGNTYYNITTRKQNVLYNQTGRVIFSQAFGQGTAAAIASETITSSANVRYLSVRFVLRNKSGGRKAPIATGGIEYVKRFGTSDPASSVAQITTRRASFLGVNTDAFTTLTLDETQRIPSPPFAGGFISWAAVAHAHPANGALYYGFVISALSSADLSGVFTVGYGQTGMNIAPATFGMYLEDSAGNWAYRRTYYPPASSSGGANATNVTMFHGEFTKLPLIDSSGVLDITDIKYFGLVWKRSGTNTATRYVTLTGLAKAAPLILTGGLTPREVSRYLNGFGDGFRASSQGELQDVWCTDVQIGDGTNITTFAGVAASVEYPYLVKNYIVDSLVNTITFKASASDTIDLRQWPVSSAKIINITLHADYSTSATTYTQGWIARGTKLTWKTGVPFTGISVIGSEVIDAKGAAVVDCVITETLATSTQAAIKFDTNSSMTRTTIDLTGTSAGYHIELGTSVTAFTLTDVTFSGTPGTDKIHVLKTTGTVTITVAGTTSLSAGDITSAGATVSIVVPTADITVTSTETNTLLQIFTTGTQTVLASTTGTSLVYTHSGETVDIVAQKAGFIPQRLTGVVLSGTMSQPFTMVTDYNYNAAHGLTYTTDASWSRANNQLTVPTWGPNIRDVYSLMIDSFISETSLRNTPFNLSMNGATSLFLLNGAEGATDASITNMTGGGVRYLSAAEVVTAEFVGILSQGVVAGSQPEYELGSGAIADARATGNVNEIIKMYGDATHGNFNKRSNLQFKVQRNGYRQAETDVLTVYGIATMEPVLYIITLTMSAIDGLTLGDPSATNLTLTDDSASPVSWDAGDGAKNYSVTITDSAANSGDTILRWLNYNLAQDATFQGKEPFFWPEMVLDNGASYETLRGILHNSPDDLVGIRVIRTGGTPHPDFTRFQSDDGTYGTPPTVGSATITNIVSGSKVRVYNVTTDTEIYLGTPGTSYSDTYTEGTDYTAGDTVRVTIHKRGYLTYVTTVVASSSGWTVLAGQEVDVVYVALGIDGSTVTGFAADYVNDEVNVTVAANFNIADMYAWWSYNLESDQGIQEFVGGITAIDQANFRINNSIVNLYLDNTTATNLRQLDNRRIFRADDAYPVKSSGGGGIDVVWKNTILIAETGVSGLTPTESAQLAAIDTVKDLVEADEVHTSAVIEKRLKGTATVILSKTWTGTPLQSFQALEGN